MKTDSAKYFVTVLLEGMKNELARLERSDRNWVYGSIKEREIFIGYELTVKIKTVDQAEALAYFAGEKCNEIRDSISKEAKMAPISDIHVLLCSLERWEVHKGMIEIRMKELSEIS